MTHSTTNTAAQSCLYPQCNCPFDAPADPNWCARGLPRATLTQQQGGEQEAGDGLPELPSRNECVTFRWLGEPINEFSDALYKHADHWSTPPWDYKDVECFYTADQMRAYATAALRTKQPAASEGDVARARGVIEQCRAALSEELAAYDIEPPIAHVKDAHDACVHWLANTSKQAAGEACGSWVGVTVKDGEWEGSFEEWQKRPSSPPVSLLYTTPPRHPADEEVDAVAYAEAEYEFEVWQDDFVQAGGTAPTVEEVMTEAGHYAMMYGQDGPVRVRYYERREFTPIAALQAGTP